MERRRTFALLAVLLASAILRSSSIADTAIIVDAGNHPDAAKAAFDEENVNWLDADKRDDAVCSQCFAAVELQRYLRRMTGRDNDFTINDDGAAPEGDLIILGGPDLNSLSREACHAWGISAEELPKLGPEGYVIKSGLLRGKSCILIAGGGRSGTLYGVYDFLHRLGCRWFGPGEIHEEIPSLKLERLPEMDVRETPKFGIRGFHAWEDRGNPDFLLWMARNRMNYWCVQQTGTNTLRKLGIMLVGGEHTIQVNNLFPHDPYPYNHAKFNGDEEKPADPYPISGEFRGDENGDGALSYFEAHPEWYGMRGGKRSSDVSRWGGGVNYCTSNADATAELLKGAMLELIDGRYRNADVINCWMLDGGKWCECDKCKALGAPTDRNLLFVYNYDKAIKKAQAEKLINRPIRLLFLAYADVLEPPTRPLPADFDYETCIATYFPIVRCYVHNFDDASCSCNSAYSRHLYGWNVDPNRHYRGQLCIGEYYNVSGYKSLPACYMRTMARDIPHYYSLGARHFHYMHCATGGWGNMALTNWQMARQLWNPEADCSELWSDYFGKRYGPAAAEMRRFYEGLELAFSNVSEIKYRFARRLNGGAADLFTSSHMKREKTGFEKDDGPDWDEILAASGECRRIIDEAMKTQLPGRIAKRIAEDEARFAYGEKTLKYYDAAVRGFSAARAGDMKDADAARREMMKLAEELKADTVSTSMSSSHANAPNAFEATFATGAIATLSSMIGPTEPSDAKAYDEQKGELILTGRDFAGGGATSYGYGLHVFPGKTKVSDDGNVVYSKGNKPADRITAWFAMGKKPDAALCIEMTGLSRPVEDDGKVSCAVFVNGRLVFADAAPFPHTGLGSCEFIVPRDAFKEGLNAIEIRNIETGGHVGGRPWFGIHNIRIGAMSKTEKPRMDAVKMGVSFEE
ncbi:MAG TPA: DUF4838 domain-containing protein [Candidatus Brocadiia bacterium]|nr:DUF4838 domain-containing protein [Candidatus Brocadiia bacterium]